MRVHVRGAAHARARARRASADLAVGLEELLGQGELAGGDGAVEGGPLLVGEHLLDEEGREAAERKGW